MERNSTSAGGSGVAHEDEDEAATYPNLAIANIDLNLHGGVSALAGVLRRRAFYLTFISLGFSLPASLNPSDVRHAVKGDAALCGYCLRGRGVFGSIRRRLDAATRKHQQYAV